ncbi:hypothetical protein AB0957_27100, partial [Streptomyces zhihengii]
LVHTGVQRREVGLDGVGQALALALLRQPPHQGGSVMPSPSDLDPASVTVTGDVPLDRPLARPAGEPAP